jgi:hypothetical protein
MADELPEWPADTPSDGEEQVNTKAKIQDRLADMLHRAFNDQPIHLGAQVITKWIVIAEVQGTNTVGPGLRWVDSDMSEWDRLGMLQYVLDEEKADSRPAWVIDDEEGDDE